MPTPTPMVVGEVGVSSRLEAVGCTGRLAMLALSGGLNIRGSAAYIHDRHTCPDSVRVALCYQLQTRFSQSPPESVGHVTGEIEGVTHLTTGILYGARFIFLFEKPVSEQETSDEARERLQSLVAAITNDVPPDDVNTRDVTCTMHGDIALPDLAMTYEEIALFVRKLPERVKEVTKKSVPVEVWLHPLGNYLPEGVTHSVPEVDTGLVTFVCDFLSCIEGGIAKCKGLLKTYATLLHYFDSIKPST